MDPSTFSILLLTFNCGKSLQPIDIIQNAVTTALTESATNPPQILVFGFEELASILDSSFGQLGPHFTPIQLGITNGLNSVYPNSEANYELAATSSVGSIATMVYILDSTALSGISPVHIVEKSIATTRRGYVYSSLKGAAAVRLSLRIKDSSSVSDNVQEFTFINAHLAANEGQVSNRNSDYYGIVTSLGFHDGFGAYKPNSHLFFMGDLNYRATLSPPSLLSSQTDSAQESLLETSASISGGSSSSSLSQLSSSATSEHYQNLIKTDELYHAMKNKHSFFGFTEAPIHFAPTYKFKVGSISTYDKKRKASWCDRILYLPYSKPVKVLKYSSIPSIVTSDHKPVYLLISVPALGPIPVFKADPSDPHKLVVAPEFAPSSSKISLSLAPNIGYYNTIGRTSDLAIGWLLYLTSTEQGRIYAGVFLVVVALYYFFF